MNIGGSKDVSLGIRDILTITNMKNTKIKIKFNVVKEIKESSRKHFKNSKRGSFAHKNKAIYTRTKKHKNVL